MGAGLDPRGARDAVDLEHPVERARGRCDTRRVAVADARLDAADDARAAAVRDRRGAGVARTSRARATTSRSSRGRRHDVGRVRRSRRGRRARRRGRRLPVGVRGALDTGRRGRSPASARRRLTRGAGSSRRPPARTGCSTSAGPKPRCSRAPGRTCSTSSWARAAGPRSPSPRTFACGRSCARTLQGLPLKLVATSATTVQIDDAPNGRVCDGRNDPRVAESRWATRWRPTSRSSRSRPTRSTPSCPPPSRARSRRSCRRERTRPSRVGGRAAVRSRPTARAARAAPAEAETEGSASRSHVLPQMGESVAEGTVLEWKAAVGDAVAVDEPLVEISTDKVDAEMPSPARHGRRDPGRAGRHGAVGSVLCRIEPRRGAPAAPEPAAQPRSRRPRTAAPVRLRQRRRQRHPGRRPHRRAPRGSTRHRSRAAARAGG